MDENQLEMILNTIQSQSPNSTIRNNQRNNLILIIQQLPDDQLLSAAHLISTMRYPKGPNKGKIYSLYLQKKAYESITQSLYKHQPTYKSLQESNTKLKADFKKLHRQNQTLIRKTQSLGVQNRHLHNQKSNYISKIRSLVRCSHQISNATFQKKIKSIFEVNKCSYTSNTVWLATSISQVGQVSLHSTVECMKLIYEFLIGEPHKIGYQFQHCVLGIKTFQNYMLMLKSVKLPMPQYLELWLMNQQEVKPKILLCVINSGIKKTRHQL
ncbi:unnamed protein product [Rhizophagus irregularis]|uniref:Uncharacterized protein n=1 Tax=Rhizophagus irregularis TaxID=588596 RepID=A0A915Z8F3_9GLOM|nr:unnamed protein product [Rhizophagus irregularis]